MACTTTVHCSSASENAAAAGKLWRLMLHVRSSEPFRGVSARFADDAVIPPFLITCNMKINRISFRFLPVIVQLHNYWNRLLFICPTLFDSYWIFSHSAHGLLHKKGRNLMSMHEPACHAPSRLSSSLHKNTRRKFFERL